MKAIGFPVRASDTAAYVWRTMATNGSKISYHSYGSVVDLNWNSNPLVYHGTGAYRPGSDPYSVTQQVVNIWKSMAFTGAVTGSLIRTICTLLTLITRFR